MIIDGRNIGPGRSPYIIAEISGNHLGSLDNAHKLIEAAWQSGADAVKLQCYEPQTITIDCDKPDFIVKDGPWKGRTLYDLYKEAHTPFAWFPILFRHAHSLGITIFASVFDNKSVDILAGLDCPAYKIASFEIVDTPLIEYAASKGKPLIISTGMATYAEILAARDAARKVPVCILHCVSGYPTPEAEANLARMATYRGIVGLSDHSQGDLIPIVATAMGAHVIEKHLCLSRSMGGPDAAFSMEPNEFKSMVDKVRTAWRATRPTSSPSEDSSRQLRRSLYAVADIAKGQIITERNVRSIRPGSGLPPSMLPHIIGRKAAADIRRGMPILHPMVES